MYNMLVCCCVLSEGVGLVEHKACWGFGGGKEEEEEGEMTKDQTMAWFRRSPQ